MKRFFCCLFVLLMPMFFLFGCGQNITSNGVVPSYLYEEDILELNNPGIGFYYPIGVTLTEQGGSYNSVNNKFNLQHLRINIGAFSKANNGTEDKPLTEAALNKLDELLTLINQKEKTAIIRFAYDGFNGKANVEASKEMMLTHIEQVSNVLNNYQNTIVAIEVGFVGPWGEMHTSKILDDSDIIKNLMQKFLTCTNNFPILVRTPKMIYNYLGISINDIDSYTIQEGTPAFRVGLFNDGYLGSPSDLGTYDNRQKETAWLSKQTAHLPYGGEVVKGKDEHAYLSEIENCLEEMNLMNLSYLNYLWNNTITQQKWVNSYYTEEIGSHSTYYGSTAQLYIKNHMGYRFLANNIKITQKKETLSISFKVNNVGFGNLTKQTNALIILEDENNNTFTYSVNNFTGQGTYNFTINQNVSEGKYNVYFCPYYEMKENVPHYTIAFANKNMYNSTLKANFLGSINILSE